MDPNIKPRMLRLETGTPKQIEDLIDLVGQDYVVTHWHFWNSGDEARITCVLVHASAIRQMQIAQAGIMGQRRQ